MKTIRSDTQTRVAQYSSSVLEEFMPFLFKELLTLENKHFDAAQLGELNVAAPRLSRSGSANSINVER